MRLWKTREELGNGFVQSMLEGDGDRLTYTTRESPIPCVCLQIVPFSPTSHSILQLISLNTPTNIGLSNSRCLRGY